MFLKKLSQNGLITIDYASNGDLHSLTGRVYRLNVKDQILSFIDDRKKFFSIPLSSIRQIY